MGYEYIERAYGKLFSQGDAVCHTVTNKCGRVMKPLKSHLHYVRVNFGIDGSGLCHPNELKHVAETTQ